MKVERRFGLRRMIWVISLTVFEEGGILKNRKKVFDEFLKTFCLKKLKSFCTFAGGFNEKNIRYGVDQRNKKEQG